MEGNKVNSPQGKHAIKAKEKKLVEMDRSRKGRKFGMNLKRLGWISLRPSGAGALKRDRSLDPDDAE